MEILNNIWIALSTPNEALTNILMLFMGILENILTMHLFITILNLKTTKNEKKTTIDTIAVTALYHRLGYGVVRWHTSYYIQFSL